MANSYTGLIKTNGEWVKVSVATNFVFTAGVKYVMQVQNSCYLKIGNAEFQVSNEKFQYTATEDDLYIKVNYGSCTLTILEGS